jgi:hypothetical protein
MLQGTEQWEQILTETESHNDAADRFDDLVEISF